MDAFLGFPKRLFTSLMSTFDITSDFVNSLDFLGHNASAKVSEVTSTIYRNLANSLDFPGHNATTTILKDTSEVPETRFNVTISSYLLNKLRD